MIFGLKAKAAIAAVVVAGAFGAGWVVKGKFEDSKDLAAMKAQQVLADQLREDLGGIVSTVEGKLQGLRANERVIDRGVIREIQTPVFRNVCVPTDSESFRLLNALAAGEDPAESDDQSSGPAAATD